MLPGSPGGSVLRVPRGRCCRHPGKDCGVGWDMNLPSEKH